MKKNDRIRRQRVIRKEALERIREQEMEEQHEAMFTGKQKVLIPHPSEPRCWIVKLINKKTV